MTDLEQALRGDRSASPGARAAALALSSQAVVQGATDLAYARVDSPLGDLLAVSSKHGLVSLAYEDGRGDELLDRLSRRISPRIVRAPERFEDLRRQLEEYFGGRRREFGLTLDWTLVGPFARRVLASATRIPFGGVSSYRELAVAAGSDRGARAAGNALGSNPMPIVVPCHRVLHSTGGLGGYTGGLDRKRFLLSLEGALPAAQ